MNEYYDTILNTSLSNRLKYDVEKQRTQELHHEKIKNSMNGLYDHIVNVDYKALIENAAQNGKFYCTLLSYKDNDTFGDFPYVFLLKGPRFYELSYFDSINVVPAIKKLYEYFHPFELVFIRDKSKKITHLNLKWHNNKKIT